MIPGIYQDQRLASATVAGSMTYTTPGTYTFTVPAYAVLIVHVFGAGGGAGGGGTGENGSAGGNSSFNGTVIATGGNFGHPAVGPATPGTGGAAVSGSGGDFSLTSQAGADGAVTTAGAGGNAADSGGAGGAQVSGMPTIPNGIINGNAGASPGGGGGGFLAWYISGNSGELGSGSGSGGGFTQKTYAHGDLAFGASITVVVGAGGQAGLSGFTRPGGAGGDGEVFITWI